MLVECKRFVSTEARRQVVGQMIEYAANGHRYWSKDLLRDYAEKSLKQGRTLEAELMDLQGPEGDSPDEFFDKVQQNLAEGQLRIVFFLDEAPEELRSIVEFLNKQMERSEVLLVEARQYRSDGKRIVVPTLFGYTEQARQVKRTVTVTTAASRRHWDEASFFADAEDRLNGKAEQLRHLFDRLKAEEFGLDWGDGKTTGTFNVKVHHSITRRALVTVYSTGVLQVGLIFLPEPIQERLKTLLKENLGLSFPPGQKCPSFAISEWGDKVNMLAESLLSIANEFSVPQDSAAL